MTLQVKVVKKADDKLGINRVSLGGPFPVDEGKDGMYIVYRGKKEDAIELLKNALGAMYGVVSACNEAGQQEPDIEPDDGKEFA